MREERKEEVEEERIKYNPDVHVNTHNTQLFIYRQASTQQTCSTPPPPPPPI